MNTLNGCNLLPISYSPIKSIRGLKLVIIIIIMVIVMAKS